MDYKFTYFKKTGEYITNGEWDGDEGFFFEYSVDREEVLDALVEIIANSDILNDSSISWLTKLQIAKNFVNKIDETDSVDEWFDSYYDELKDIFHDEALEYVLEN